MLSKVSVHLEKLSQKCPAIRRQFYPNPLEGRDRTGKDDPLMEDSHSPVRGLIHKYKNRALILLTLNCASYCRFCTRRRTVSDVKAGILRDEDLEQIVTYLKGHSEIRDLIISGGDPLTEPELLRKALTYFSNLPQIKIIRIGTRLPVSNPRQVSPKLLKVLRLVKKQPLYIGIHFEHPSEINPETIAAVNKLRKIGAILYSQSVFLKGVNDSVSILRELFTRLIEIGVKPYYIYRCDPVKGAHHFIVPFKKEVAIMTRLRKELSGLAYPIYVVDTPDGAGKVPVPLNFWQWNNKSFTDFADNSFRIE